MPTSEAREKAEREQAVVEREQAVVAARAVRVVMAIRRHCSSTHTLSPSPVEPSTDVREVHQIGIARWWALAMHRWRR